MTDEQKLLVVNCKKELHAVFSKYGVKVVTEAGRGDSEWSSVDVVLTDGDEELSIFSDINNETTKSYLEEVDFELNTEERKLSTAFEEFPSESIKKQGREFVTISKFGKNRFMSLFGDRAGCRLFNIDCITKFEVIDLVGDSTKFNLCIFNCDGEIIFIRDRGIVVTDLRF